MQEGRLSVMVPFEIHRPKLVPDEAANLVHADTQAPHPEETARSGKRVRTVRLRV